MTVCQKHRFDNPDNPGKGGHNDFLLEFISFRPECTTASQPQSLFRGEGREIVKPESSSTEQQPMTWQLGEQHSSNIMWRVRITLMNAGRMLLSNVNWFFYQRLKC